MRNDRLTQTASELGRSTCATSGHSLGSLYGVPINWKALPNGTPSAGNLHLTPPNSDAFLRRFGRAAEIALT